MAPERQVLCRDIAFALLVGAPTYAIGLYWLTTRKVPIYLPYEPIAVGLLVVAALVLWFVSLPSENDEPKEDE